MMVPPGRLELPLPKKPDFESGASTNSATGAYLRLIASMDVNDPVQRINIVD